MTSELYKYQYKIKTAQEVCDIIGPPPRTEKAIMCHGVFDIVHPGHMRHLLYAKSKGDTLVVSMTADRFITKANARPYVPEDLRALNLAAFEMVDYVVIDHQPKPLDNIALIQPDYFAKGYEYVSGKEITPMSREERDIVEGYGGEMLFTPGDIVYSSSQILENIAPDIAHEKLMVLMDAENITFDDLRTAAMKIKGTKVHVVGDMIVDTFTHCSMIGGMTKTPTMSVRYENKQDYVGGAGVVAKHMQAAGANVTLTTVLGDDDLGRMAEADLREAGITVDALVDATRPTTNKNAIIVADYRMLKVDTLDNRAISDRLVQDICEHIQTYDSEAVVFSDFRHGIFNSHNIPDYVDAIPDDKFKVADSQVASRWGNIIEFQGFDLISPNEREARFALGDQDTVIRPLGSQLYERAKCKTLMLKLGPRGMITYRGPSDSDGRFFFAMDSLCRKVVDPVGAGDALLAYATLALMATNNSVIASIIGSIAAGLECELDGNFPIAFDAVINRIVSLEREMQWESPSSLHIQ
jgi:rfaE bifunctional protein kinase chain/domain